MFQKILIANRGEIALRIMKTAKEMGMETVAVYSEADTNALFVQEADEAIYIGPSPSVESYLNIDAICAAIRESGADCVHPGYGFLSENTEFASAVEAAGATFIGPPADAIKSMGDKIEAKAAAKKAGVNIIPGSDGAIDDEKTALKVAKKIGYPVMIKASAGGGGKGMRIVNKEEDLSEAMRAAIQEAGSSFGDKRVFIEKFIEQPRHIEIQVLADKHGNILTLLERECSVQRRHQKVIEEAPSPFIDEKTRNAMSKQSKALAKAVGYFSAGTVEFVVDKNKKFYFLEMNTRLQVEHRVTELITGIDLVEQMIRVAAGEKLEIKQKDIKPHGWAIESRIYAEDPKRNFLPSVGRVTRYKEPTGIDGMVLDSGVYEGDEVSMFYDPMIAKLCTHASTREEAIEEMGTALSSYVIRGIDHNISFLDAVIHHPRFQAGDITTHFIEDEYPAGFQGAELTSETTTVMLAVGVFLRLKYRERDALISGQMLCHEVPFINRWVVVIDNVLYPVTVHEKGNGYDIELDDNSIVTVRSDWELGRRLLQGTVNGKPISVQAKRTTEGLLVTYGGATVEVRVRTPRVAKYAQYLKTKETTHKLMELPAPLAGLVTGVRVKQGESVKVGEPLVTIEAMKMENTITAEAPVTIKKLHVAQGDSVSNGQILMEFE